MNRRRTLTRVGCERIQIVPRVLAEMLLPQYGSQAVDSSASLLDTKHRVLRTTA